MFMVLFMIGDHDFSALSVWLSTFKAILYRPMNIIKS